MSRLPLRPGEIIGGRYRVEGVLGSGAMGTVIAVTHVDLGVRFALKLMSEHLLRDAELAARFAKEARAAAAITSAHGTKVTDVGRLPSGEAFIVMEYLEGEDFNCILERCGRLAPRDAVDWILQACEAIAEAHARGIIHRDLKLSNLFLIRLVSGAPFVKVLDFGLAKTREAAGGALTNTTDVFGTPQYMSPEQTRSAKSVDARTDIWSLGVCLYELLTGALPFDAPTVMEVCARILKDPPTPFAHVLDPRARALVPPALETAVMRCLEKDQARRWQSVAELAQGVEPFGSVPGAGRAIARVAAMALGPA